MLKLEYWNGCDIGNIVYLNGYKNVWYFDVDTGKPSYEIIEEGVEDGDKNFIPQFTKMVKKYKFETIMPEYQFDTLNFAALHDYKVITLANGEASRCLTFQVENKGWDARGSDVTVEVSFSVDYIVKTNCCNLLVATTQCASCEKTIYGTVQSGTLPYIDPFNNGGKASKIYMVYPSVITDPSELMILNTALVKWSKPKQEYDYVCLTSGGINYKWYRDNSGKYRLYQYIKSITIGATSNFRAYCLPNTFAQLYISNDNINFVASGQPVFKNNAESIGFSVNLTAGTYYVKFYLFDSSCNYGFSNTLTVIIT